jgi:hypothetical protein
MQQGGCYCEAIRFEVGSLGPLVNCHCRSCRRVHGAAFMTVALVATSDLRFLEGETRVREFPSGEGSRFFCSQCGSRLFNRPASNAGITMLLVSTLDTEPEQPPIMHINVGSKAPWHEIRDELPQHNGLPAVATATLESR